MRYLFWGLLCLFLNLQVLEAQSPIELSGKTDMRFIGKSVSYWTDSTESLTFSHILTSEIQDKFRAGTEQILEFEGNPHSIWIKIQTYHTQSERHWVLQSHTLSSADTVQFFAVLPDGYTLQEINPLQKFSERPVRAGHHIFELHPNADTYYLRIHSSGLWRLSLRLASWKNLFEYYHERDFLQGLFFGILILSGIIALIIGFVIHSKIFYYYALYIFGILITNGAWEGLLFEWLWANFPTLNYFDPSKFIFFMLAIPFVASFLHTKQNAPKLHRLFYGLVILYVIGLIINILGFISLTYYLIDIALFLTLIQIFVVSVVIYRQDYRPAKLFLVAWLPFLVGIMITFLQDAGVLPHNPFTFHAVKVGTVWEILVLSWAISMRINELRQEREGATKKALHALRQNEQMIREHNKLLEAQVAKRTAELAQKNQALENHEQELEQALHDLQAKEAQLVQSEKMTSLGVLTAGIAHELNNPISFMNAGVYALERNLSEILKVTGLYEQITDENYPQILHQIEAEKADIEYEESLAEIRELIQGIKSGAKRTERIVKALRLFSRLDEADVKTIDIHKNLDNVLVMLTNRWKNRIEIIRNYQDIPKIECFAGKLNQVFMNIILNAIQATEQDGKLTITTQLVPDNQCPMVRISVKDTGKGIPQNARTHIFEPFYTTKPVGEGTGLGLAVSYSIIQEHGGKLDFTSQENIGTEFWIDLPVSSKIKENASET